MAVNGRRPEGAVTLGRFTLLSSRILPGGREAREVWLTIS